MEPKILHRKDHKYRFDLGFKFVGRVQYEYWAGNGAYGKKPVANKRETDIEWEIFRRAIVTFEGDNKPHELYFVLGERLNPLLGERKREGRNLFEWQIQEMIRDQMELKCRTLFI